MLMAHRIGLSHEKRNLDLAADLQHLQRDRLAASAGRSDLLAQNSLILMDGADGLDFVFGSEELLFDLESLELPDDSP